MKKLIVITTVFLSTLGSPVSADQSNKKIIFADDSVLLNDLHVSHVSGGYVKEGIDGTDVFYPTRKGWVTFEITLDEDDDGSIVLPSGDTLPLPNIYTMDKNQASFWVPCDVVDSSNGGVKGVIIFSHPHKKEDRYQRNFVLDAMNPDLKPYQNETGLPIAAIYITTSPLDSKDDHSLPLCDEEYAYTGCSGTGFDDTDRKSGRGGKRPFYPTDTPLFNQMDALFESVSGLSANMPVPIRSGKTWIESLNLSYKPNYTNQIIEHRERLVQISYAECAYCSHPDSGGATAAELEPLETIMNWVALKIDNKGLLYRLYARMCNSVNITPIDKKLFLNMHITADDELNTEVFLAFMEQQFPENLARHLKTQLQKMRMPFPRDVIAAFDQLVGVLPNQQGRGAVAYLKQPTAIYSLRPDQDQDQDQDQNQDWAIGMINEAFKTGRTTNSRFLGAATHSVDGTSTMLTMKHQKNQAEIEAGTKVELAARGGGGGGRRKILTRTNQESRTLEEVTKDSTDQIRTHGSEKPHDPDHPEKVTVVTLQ